jgi:Gpi18-like mannosyltransferase
VYGVGGDPPEHRLLRYGTQHTTVDYPPAALYCLALVGKAYRALWPDFPNDWRLTVAVKIPGLLAGLALTGVLYGAIRRLSGDESRARWAAAAFWANPAAILNGEVLGYLDPLVMLPGVGALLGLHLGRPRLAGALFALALLAKPQGLLLGPAILVAAWQTGGVRRSIETAVAGAATLAAGVLPYVVIGAFPNMPNAFGSWQFRRDIVSGYAANLWWIATWLARGYNMIPEFGFPARTSRTCAGSSRSRAGWRWGFRTRGRSAPRWCSEPRSGRSAVRGEARVSRSTPHSGPSSSTRSLRSA